MAKLTFPLHFEDEVVEEFFNSRISDFHKLKVASHLISCNLTNFEINSFTRTVFSKKKLGYEKYVFSYDWSVLDCIWFAANEENYLDACLLQFSQRLEYYSVKEVAEKFGATDYEELKKWQRPGAGWKIPKY
jgi:hypothetical protein